MRAGPSTPPSRFAIGRRAATALVLGVGIAVAQAASAAHAAPSTPAPAAKKAPAVGSAANGGAVIVWLKDQHSNLNLSTQGKARTAAAHADQKPIVASIKASGGSHILRLVSVNAVAAHVSAAEVQALRTNPAVLRIIPDTKVTVGDRETRGPQAVHAVTTPDKDAVKSARKHANAADDGPGVNPFPTANDCGTLDNPLIEPEALGDIHAPAMTNNGLATEPGHGVIVANDGISSPPNFSLVGNPNFVRPAADGGGSVVVDAEPGDTTDATDGEYYGDASSIAAQGTVEYQYSHELPFANLPDNCYFKLVGDAPGASLIDTENINTPESGAGDPAMLSESQIVEGIDAAVIQEHADVINESYGYGNSPGNYIAHYAANDAAVDAGVTVVASSGDSGVQGTVSSPASDPKIIAAGATNTLRLNAMAYGFTGWVNDDITPLSSGGTTPDNKVVDLVAPGYGGEAACNPNGSDCPENTQTEAFGGTSESSPLIAGAAADVIQAYRDSHNGESPSPALVKQILTSTATDVHAPADQQGSGLLNIAAAIDAAKHMTNTTPGAGGTGSHLVVNPTQLDLSGAGGSTSFQKVNVFNASNAPATVTGNFRTLGPEQQLGDVVTEAVSAPDNSVFVPVDGAKAADDISFTVPAGLDRIDADMIWPDPTNSNILSFTLTDPEGRLRQISYDYGSAATQTRAGTVPNIQHVEVANPEAGTWRAQIKWANGRSHLQEPPNVPGSYSGNLQFKVSSQNFVTEPASSPVTIAAHRSANIPVAVTFPNDPGDHPQSIQFTADNGAATSVPVARRTLIPSDGGEFDSVMRNSVGRGNGQISTFDINVPAGRKDLGVTLTTPDISADDGMTLFMVNPNGTSVATHTVTSGNPPRTRTVNGVLLTTQTVNGTPVSTATFHAANPAEGTWEIDVELNLTTSGQEFRQTVVGDVLPQAPAISSPATGARLDTQTPTISGTGEPGDTVTVKDGGGNTVCTAPVGDDGAWSCTASPLADGSVTLTATQADQTGDPSSASDPVTVSVPSTTSVSLGIQPDAPTAGDPVTLTATTTNVPDGTTVTFTDDGTSIGTGSVSGNAATLSLPDGLGVGDHPLQASVPATDTSLAAESPVLDVVVGKTASTIALSLDDSTVSYGYAATGSVSVSGATDGNATVTIRSTSISVPIGADGSGTFTLPTKEPVGAHRVSATFDGTDTVAASNTATARLTVVPATSTTSAAPAKTTVAKGSTLKVTVHVAGHADALYPSGHVTVTFTVGGKTKSATTLMKEGDHGAVTITVDVPSKTGQGEVLAAYQGNERYTASTSTPTAVTVN